MNKLYELEYVNEEYNIDDIKIYAHYWINNKEKITRIVRKISLIICFISAISYLIFSLIEDASLPIIFIFMLLVIGIGVYIVFDDKVCTNIIVNKLKKEGKHKLFILTAYEDSIEVKNEEMTINVKYTLIKDIYENENLLVIEDFVWLLKKKVSEEDLLKIKTILKEKCTNAKYIEIKDNNDY